MDSIKLAERIAEEIEGSYGVEQIEPIFYENIWESDFLSCYAVKRDFIDRMAAIIDVYVAAEKLNHD